MKAFPAYEDLFVSETIPNHPSYQTKITSDISMILDLEKNHPKIGESISAVGCYSDTGKCFRISGKYSELYHDGKNQIFGLWFTPNQYNILTKDRPSNLTNGFS